MLRLCGRPDIPVCAGIRVPAAFLQRGGKPEEYGNRPNHTQLVTGDDPESGRDYPDAIDFILKSLDDGAEPIGLIATGPWTNIAAVLTRGSDEQRSKIRFLSLMGGEVHWMHKEANVSNDPEAADVVLRSGLPTFMGTWDVTRRLYFTMAEVERLLAPKRTPFLQALLEATRLWWGGGRGPKPGPVLYDVIPVFQAAGPDPRIVSIRLDKVCVELEGVHARGLTLPSPHASRWAVLEAEKQAGAFGIEEAGEGVLLSHEIDAAALKQEYVSLVFG